MACFRQSAITVPNIGYAAKHLCRLLPVLAKAVRRREPVKFDVIFAWSELTLPRRHRRAMRLLMKSAHRNPYNNSYHHPWHTVAVMVIALLIARRHRLLVFDKSNLGLELGLAAFAHDFGHRGRRMSSMPFVEESRSGLLVSRRLYSGGSVGRARRLFMARLKMTSITGLRDFSAGDDVAAILADADIFASLFFAYGEVIASTKGLLGETTAVARLPTSPHEMLWHFIAALADDGGLKHIETRRLAASLSQRNSAVFINPLAAKRLGFSVDFLQSSDGTYKSLLP